MKRKIAKLVGEVAERLGAQMEDLDKVRVELTENLDFGDYATNAPFILAKVLNLSPKEVAEKMRDDLEERAGQDFKKIEVAGNGYINFYLADDYFVEQIGQVLKEKEKYGAAETGKGKTVVVEYSSPNIAKPFTVGHLRSTVIGDAVANLLDFSGYKVVRDNHLGDWGAQFGKQLAAIKRWGDEKQIEESENPIKELVALYVRFNKEAEEDESLKNEAREWFKKLEEGDKEAIDLWRKSVSWSKLEFDKIYERLGIKFDTELGESSYIEGVPEVYKELERKDWYRESEGAKLAFFEEENYPPIILQKNDGTSIYAARDLAADLYRKKEYGEDVKIINEAGSEQELYFKQIYEIEKKLGWFEEGQRVHVSHGLYRFKDGKMSTRKGNVIWLEDVLDEAVKRASEFNAGVAEEVGMGAIKYNDLKRETAKNVVFDWDEIINLKGNSGPYIQYSYSRANSILVKAKEEGIKADIKKTDEISELEREITRFGEAVAMAAERLEPHYVATYLYRLAGVFNSYYENNKVVSKDEGSAYKVAVVAVAKQVMANGLGLLGIKAPERI